MNIAHISDLHTGLSEKQTENIETLVAKIHKLCIDHLIITGDITARGHDHEFHTIIRILKKYDLFSSERLTVIPGNHDLFRFVLKYYHFASDVIKKMHRLPVVLGKAILFNENKYNEEIIRFHNFFNNGYQNALMDSNTPFPSAKAIGNGIILICVDSNKVIKLLKNKGISNGEIESGNLEKLLKDPQLVGKTKILLMHHYLYPENEIIKACGSKFSSYMKLYNRLEIIHLLEQYKVDLVLHGHYHINSKYKLLNSIKVLNSGGSYYGTNYNLITVKNRDIKTKIIRINESIDLT